MFVVFPWFLWSGESKFMVFCGCYQSYWVVGMSWCETQSIVWLLPEFLGHWFFVGSTGFLSSETGNLILSLVISCDCTSIFLGLFWILRGK